MVVKNYLIIDWYSMRAPWHCSSKRHQLCHGQHMCVEQLWENIQRKLVQPSPLKVSHYFVCLSILCFSFYQRKALPWCIFVLYNINGCQVSVILVRRLNLEVHTLPTKTLHVHRSYIYFLSSPGPLAQICVSNHIHLISMHSFNLVLTKLFFVSLRH